MRRQFSEAGAGKWNAGTQADGWTVFGGFAAIVVLAVGVNPLIDIWQLLRPIHTGTARLRN